jgi:hypothetical protein
MIYIVYAQKTGIVRRVVSTADEMPAPEIVSGEKILSYPGQLKKDQISTIPFLQQHVIDTLGITLDDRPVVAIDKDGSIFSILNADPEIDKLPGYELMHAPKGTTIDDKFDREKGVFVKSYKEPLEEKPNQPTPNFEVTANG